jgi:hypothetical protein
LRKRGGDGRTISGSRAVMADSPLPNCLAAGHGHHHHPVAGQVVGQLDRTGGMAIGIGRTAGAKVARALKSVRRAIGGAAAPDPHGAFSMPPSHGGGGHGRCGMAAPWHFLLGIACGTPAPGALRVVRITMLLRRW